MGIVFAFDLFVLFLKTEIQKDLVEKVKLGVKRGYDKSETFFKELFEKKTSLIDESADVSKIKVEKIAEKTSMKKEKNEEIHFKKIELDIEQNSNS